ncbi:MAG: HD domain-containing protein [Bacteroidales bacterium]|nr:HD domain-containing protein [Bacteroidales bacterium]
MDYEGVKKLVFNKLKHGLSDDLRYHSPQHTQDVLEAAIRLAQMEGINGNDLELLKTAVVFHDLGFIISYKQHEKESVKLAKEILPKYGYSIDDIDKIEGMIMSTEIPQKPSNKLEEIIADADLDYLGRDDIFLISQRLQYEWKQLGIVTTLRDWHEKQLQFMKNHDYHTESAKKLRREKKLKNIEELEILLCLKK